MRGRKEQINTQVQIKDTERINSGFIFQTRMLFKRKQKVMVARTLYLFKPGLKSS